MRDAAGMLCMDGWMMLGKVGAALPCPACPVFSWPMSNLSVGAVIWLPVRAMCRYLKPSISRAFATRLVNGGVALLCSALSRAQLFTVPLVLPVSALVCRCLPSPPLARLLYAHTLHSRLLLLLSRVILSTSFALFRSYFRMAWRWRWRCYTC